MKKTAFISAVILITLSIQSCRQLDDNISPVEAATLQKVQDSSNDLSGKNDITIKDIEQSNSTSSLVDGEILPPPRK